MASHQIIGIYSSMARARLAVEALVDEGVPEERVALSVDLTQDGIAAEAPGQSYVNQPSDRGGWFGSAAAERRREARPSGPGDSLHRGACVVTADARSADEAERARRIMAWLRPLDVRTPQAA